LLAQLVERFVYTEDVGSSSLSQPTIKRQSHNLKRMIKGFCQSRPYPSHVSDELRRCFVNLFGAAKEKIKLVEKTKC
jgi:hypothetical protein